MAGEAGGLTAEKRRRSAQLARQQGQSGKLADEADGFEADGDDLTDEADDVLGIVLAVGVVDDAGAFVGGDAVLVDYPFEGAAIAEAVFVDFGRDAAQGEKVVVLELGLVFARATSFRRASRACRFRYVPGRILAASRNRCGASSSSAPMRA